MTLLNILNTSTPPTPGREGTSALSAAEISLRLGGDGLVSVDGWSRAPCPAHGGTGNNLSLKIDAAGRLCAVCHSHHCSRDEIARALDEQLGTRFGRPDAAAEFADDVNRVADDVDQVAGSNSAETRAATAALALWRAEEAGYRAMLAQSGAERCFTTARPVERGDLVDRYLHARSIRLAQFPAALRLHPGLWHRESQTRWPAIVAKVTSSTGKVLTIHRTFLDPHGAGKAPVDPPRKLLGSMRGGAVRLFDPGGETLIVAEGVETTLAALVLAKWSYAGWAAVSTAGLVTLRAPPRFRRIVIAADNDASGAGLCAAQALAKRLRATGRRVDIRMPPTIGADWNDVLVEQLEQGGTP